MLGEVVPSCSVRDATRLSVQRSLFVLAFLPVAGVIGKHIIMIKASNGWCFLRLLIPVDEKRFQTNIATLSLADIESPIIIARRENRRDFKSPNADIGQLNWGGVGYKLPLSFQHGQLTASGDLRSPGPMAVTQNTGPVEWRSCLPNLDSAVGDSLMVA